MMHFLASIGIFAAYLAVSLLIAALFVAAYIRTTPHHELELIRKGNAAAALGLVGALIGFAIVLSRAIGFSTGIVETMLWGIVGLVVQVAGHWLLSCLMPRLYTAIEEGELSAGIIKAGVAIALGLISAASMTP